MARASPDHRTWLPTKTLFEWADRFFALGAGTKQGAASPVNTPDPTPVALVFDTETDGGAGGQLAIQLAWVVYNARGEELFARSEYLALPPGRRISWHATKVHGISMATIQSKGMVPQFVLGDFFAWVDRVGLHDGDVVAHNAAFDAQVVTNTAISCGLVRDLLPIQCLCTMEQSKHRLALRNRRGGIKPPKNSELYAYLVGIELDHSTLHDALADVRVTASSYFAGKKKGWW